jgi:hypothetical protein
MRELQPFAPTTPALTWLPSMDIHEREGYLVVTVEPAPGDGAESDIDERGWELVDRLGLPFHPEASRVATRLVHGSLEVRLRLPET